MTAEKTKINYLCVGYLINRPGGGLRYLHIRIQGYLNIYLSIYILYLDIPVRIRIEY